MDDGSSEHINDDNSRQLKKRKLEEEQTKVKKNLEKMRETRENLTTQNFFGSQQQNEFLVYGKNDQGPFFVIVKHEENDKKMTDLQAGRIMVSLNIKGVKSVDRVNPYTAKVNFNNYHEANSLLMNANLKMKQIKAYVPTNILTKKGVIHDISLENTIADIKMNISCRSPIVDIQRMTQRNKHYEQSKPDSKENPRFIDTERIIVTFRAQELPQEVQIFYAKRKVDLYRPRVKFCNQCQSYGHVNTEKFPCKNQKACEKCGETHENEEEKCSERCKFCKDKHRPSFWKCPKHSEEQKLETEAYYSNKSVKEVRAEKAAITNKFMGNANPYELLSQFPDLPETEDSDKDEGKNNFHRNFKKSDDRLTKLTQQKETTPKSFSNVLKNSQQQPTTSYLLQMENLKAKISDFEKKELLQKAREAKEKAREKMNSEKLRETQIAAAKYEKIIELKNSTKAKSIKVNKISEIEEIEMEIGNTIEVTSENEKCLSDDEMETNEKLNMN